MRHHHDVIKYSLTTTEMTSPRAQTSTATPSVSIIDIQRSFATITTASTVHSILF
jgi:hypothetical protein